MLRLVTLISSLLFGVLFRSAWSEIGLPGRDVLLRPITDTGVEVCMIFIQGADIPPEQYIPTAKAFQHATSSSMKLWVGIPEFPNDTAEPLVLDKGIERMLQIMTKAGMSSSMLIMAGHSLGGAMVQLWTEKNKDRVAAQVLMGSFLTRQWKTDYVLSYPVPTLTIGGELDGLARVTRIAEAYYTQLIDEASKVASAWSTFPVTVVEGSTHMQFASGTPPSLVFERDLRPEISYEEAHKRIAEDVSSFLNVRLLSDKTASAFLSKRLQDTEAFIQPILNALIFEGYHNFRPPCLCGTDVCTPMPNCTAYCPFTHMISQAQMGSGLEGVVVNNTDSFHDVWETQPTVHLPAVHNSCEQTDGCTLDTTTITQAVYNTGEDLEIWKKHFDVPWMDSGFFPISAVELRTKLNSRQSIFYHAGVADASFDELDGGGVRCGEVNQKSLDWANSNAGAKTLDRFASYGQPYTIGPDVDVCPAGPCWIWQELHYTPSDDGSVVELTSPQFSTALDFPLPMTAGFHYCKVLSPARATEWMYVDGLRAKYSLKNSQTELH